MDLTRKLSARGAVFGEDTGRGMQMSGYALFNYKVTEDVSTHVQYDTGGRVGNPKATVGVGYGQGKKGFAVTIDLVREICDTCKSAIMARALYAF
jgi:hypothetical protein